MYFYRNDNKFWAFVALLVTFFGGMWVIGLLTPFIPNPFPTLLQGLLVLYCIFWGIDIIRAPSRPI